jgi:hypothetical protein
MERKDPLHPVGARAIGYDVVNSAAAKPTIVSIVYFDQLSATWLHPAVEWELCCIAVARHPANSGDSCHGNPSLHMITHFCPQVKKLVVVPKTASRQG